LAIRPASLQTKIMADTAVDLSGDIEVKEPLLNESGKGFPGLNFAFTTPVAKEWIQHRRQNVRPWSTFVNTNKFTLPHSPALISQRLVRNIDHFQSNYLCVFIVLVLYCLITSPLLLIAVAASLGACYIIKIRNEQNRIHILGHEVNLAQQYALVGLCSFPLFLLAGAGSAIFWIIGASFFLIMLHASFYAIETLNNEEEGFDLKMEHI